MSITAVPISIFRVLAPTAATEAWLLESHRLGCLRCQNHIVLRGRKRYQEVMQFGEKHQPACVLAHDVVNKLSAIVGFCDLLVENAEQRDTECVKRLMSIHMSSGLLRFQLPGVATASYGC